MVFSRFLILFRRGVTNRRPRGRMFFLVPSRHTRMIGSVRPWGSPTDPLGPEKCCLKKKSPGDHRSYEEETFSPPSKTRTFHARLEGKKEEAPFSSSSCYGKKREKIVFLAEKREVLDILVFHFFSLNGFLSLIFALEEKLGRSSDGERDNSCTYDPPV